MPPPARYTRSMIVNFCCAGWAVREAAKPVRREDKICEYGFFRIPAGRRHGWIGGCA